jgi:predicted glycoside hydrolase/deacetylase ChbG (UPF0249 family)
MTPNPVLRRLGLSDDDRVAIIHADDIGMCQASVAAYADLAAFGLVTSGAVMVPCGWFPAAADNRGHQERDLGVHLTLTCEWDAYRWAPISTSDPASGMRDAEGYFYRSTEAAQAHGQPDAVARELAAQIERALSAGVQPTHVDTHMGVVYCPAFLPSYIDLACRYRLPPMFFRGDAAAWQASGMDADFATVAARLSQTLEADGVPLIDHITMLPLDDPRDRLVRAKQAFDALQPGLTHFIIHPAHDTPELRAIAADWRCRVADYETFMSDDLLAYIQSSGVHVIGYRALQELMPEP